MSKKPNIRSAGADDAVLGHRIRLRRVEMKLSQSDLGNALGVSFQQIQKYEKGFNRVGAARLIMIGKVLEVPMSFFYGEATKKESEVESLLFEDPRFSLRLLRAYAAIQDIVVKRNFISLMERVAGFVEAAE